MNFDESLNQIYSDLDYLDGFGSDNEPQTDNTFDPMLTNEDPMLEDFGNYYKKQRELDHQAEMKKGEMYRQGEIKYDSSGDPINDSNATIRAKQAGNAVIKGADWLLEASENIGDFGQGDWIEHYDGFKANLDGRRYSMGNKDIIGARDTTVDEMQQQYNQAENDPLSDEVIYTLRKFDGYDDAGKARYIYKNGFTNSTTDKRYTGYGQNVFRDGWELVNEKRFAGAEDWEKKWNALSGVLDKRTLGNGFDQVDVDGRMMTRDKASGIGFGSGSSEMLNEDLLGVDTGTSADYAKNLAESEQLHKDEYSGYHDNSFIGRGINTLAGAGSMFTKAAIVDTVDWIGETVGIGDVGTEEEKRKFTQDLFGYDDYFAKKNMAKIEHNINDMIDNGLSWDNVSSTVGHALANIETTGESVGYLGGLVLGFGKFTKVGKGLQRISNMEKAGKFGTDAAKAAEKAAKLTDKVMKAASPAQKASYHLGRQSGLINMTAGMTNDHIDAFKENNNGVGPTPAELTFMFMNNLVAIGTDKLTDISVLKGAGIWKTAKDSIKDVAKDNLPKIASKVLETTGSLTASMGKEFAQEYYQTMSEEINKQWGTDKYGDNLMDIVASRENQVQSLAGGAAGAGGAAHFYGAGAIPKAGRAIADRNKESEPVVDEAAGDDTAINVGSGNPEYAPYEQAIEDAKIAYNSNQQKIKTIIEGKVKAGEGLTQEEKEKFLEIQNQGVNDIEFAQEQFRAFKEQKNQSSMDENAAASEEELSGFKRADVQVDEDGNVFFDPIESLAEAEDIYENGIKNYRQRIVESKILEVDGKQKTEDIKTILNLGSAKAVSERMDTAIAKLDGQVLNENDQKKLDDLKVESSAFKAELNDIFENKIDGYSLEDIDQMSKSEAITTFGSMFAPSDIEVPAAASQSGSGPAKTQDLDQALKSSEKKAAVAEKMGQPKAAKEYKAQASKLKKVKLSVEQITNEDVFKGEKSLVKQIEKALMTGDYEQSLNESMAETIEYTKKYMADNGYVREDGGPIDGSDVEIFLGKGETRWGRGGYYPKLMADGHVSVQNIEKKLESAGGFGGKVVKTLQDKITQKTSRMMAFQKEIGSLRKKFSNDIKSLMAGTYEKTMSIEEMDENSNAETYPAMSREEAIKILKTEVGNTPHKFKRDDINFEIFEKDILDYLEKGKDYRGGIVKATLGLQREVRILKSLIDDNGNLQIPDTIKKEQENIEKADQKTKEQEIKKTTGRDVNLSGGKDFLENQKRIEQLKKDLIEAEAKVDRQKKLKDDGSTTLQGEIIDSIDGITDAIKRIFKEYMSLKNQAGKLSGENKALKKDIENIGKEIRNIENQKKEIVKEINDKGGVDYKEESIIGMSKIKGFRKKLKALFRGIIGLIEGNKKKPGLKQLNENIEKLRDQQKSKQKEIDYNEVSKEELKSEQKDLNIDRKITDELTKKERLKKSISRRKVAVLKKTIKRLKDKTLTPNNTLLAFANQSKSAKKTDVEKMNFGTESKTKSAESIKKAKDTAKITPIDVSSYADTNKEASSLMSTMSVNDMDSETLNYYVGKAKEFVEESGILEYMNSKITGKNNEYMNLYAPFLSLLPKGEKNGDYKFEDLNENLLVSVMIAADNMLRSDGGSMYMKSKEDVGKMLGLSEWQVTSEMYNTFKKFTRRNNLVNTAGGDVLGMNDIIAKKDGDIEGFARFKSSAGLLVAKALEMRKNKNGKPVLKQEEMSVDMYNKIVGKHATADEKTKALVNFYSMEAQLSEEEIKEIKDRLLDVENNNIIPRNQSSALFVQPKEVKYGERTQKGLENLEMIVNENMNDALNLAEAQTYNVLMDGTNVLFSDKIGEDSALKAMGWRSEENIEADKTKSRNEKDSEIAASIEIKSEFDELKALIENIQDPNNSLVNELWFKFFMSVNGRINSDSVLIDPMDNKELHRWLVVPKKLNVKYSYSDIASNDMNMDSDVAKRAGGFKYGIAQAFGFDIDKETPEAVFAYANHLLNSVSEKDMLTVLNGGKVDGIKGFDHLGHGIQAYTAIGAYKDAGKIIKGGKTTSLFNAVVTGEFDGITNGVAIKTLQIPLGDNAIAMLFKTGIVVNNTDNSIKDSEYQTGVKYDDFEGSVYEIAESADARAKGEKSSVLDTYLTLAQNTNLDEEYVSSQLEDAEAANKGKPIDVYELGKPVKKKDGTDGMPFMEYMPGANDSFSKSIRDLFKYPTIIIQYGGAIPTIMKRIAEESTIAMISDLLVGINKDKNSVEYKKAHYTLGLIAKQHNVKSVEELVQEIQDVPLDQIKAKNGKSLEENLNNMFYVTISESAAKAIKDIFGPIIKITENINKSSQYMFRIYEQAMENEIQKKLAESDDEILVLSPEVIQEITVGLKGLMPIVNSPDSIDRVKEGIAIISRKLVPNEGLRLSEMQGQIKYMVDGKSYSMSARSFISMLSEAYASAGVLPTHGEDGSDMAHTIVGSMAKHGMTNIHDAIVTGGLSFYEVLQDYNKNFIENSKSYDMVNEFVSAMREVMESAEKYNALDGNAETIKLDDMRNKEEKAELTKSANKNKEEYKPLSYSEVLHKMENQAEEVWSARHRLFANDIKVDQMPAVHSMVTEKAKYEAETYKNELEKRILRRADVMTDEQKSLLIGKDGAVKIAILNMIKPPAGKASETKKINYSIDFIDIITKTLNGAC